VRVTAEEAGLLGEVPAAPVLLASQRDTRELVYAAPARQGWQAKLDLAFEPRFGRTAITRQSHLGPLRIQRPFYPERNGTCHVYVLHPPGGVVGGDLLEVTLEGAPGSRALITTPGATKLYRSLGPQAQIRQNIKLSGDACLDWFPQETIAFEGAHASIQTRVQLDREASYAGWEIVCLGRPAVPTMSGASEFSFLSPVSMPTRLAPNSSLNSWYLEFVSAFSGDVYQARRPFSRSRRISSRAIHVLPLPVGAVTSTSSNSNIASASSWKGSGLKGDGRGVPIPARSL
jgi:hypothetical protein